MHWQSEWRINLSWLGRIWWKLGFHDSLHIKYHPILLWIIHLLSLPRRRWSHSRGPDTLTSRIDITACFIHAQIHTTCYCCVRCAHRDSHSSTILPKKKNAEKWSWFHIFRLGQTMKTAKKKCIYRCENNGLLKAASIQFWVPVIFFPLSIVDDGKRLCSGPVTHSGDGVHLCGDIRSTPNTDFIHVRCCVFRCDQWRWTMRDTNRKCGSQQ